MAKGMVGIEVSLVVPAFDEAARIVGTVRAALGYLGELGVRFEVIVVDDGSADGTGAVVEGAFADELGAERLRLVCLTPNHGKGYAVRRGMAESRGRYVIFTDADLATPLEEIEPCLSLLRDGADAVFGSRHLPDSRILRPQPLRRRLVGVLGRILTRLILWTGVSDLQCGFKGMRRQAARAFVEGSVVDGYGFDAEFVALGRSRGWRIEELPVSWRHREPSKIRLGRDAVGILWNVLRVRWRELLGKY